MNPDDAFQTWWKAFLAAGPQSVPDPAPRLPEGSTLEFDTTPIRQDLAPAAKASQDAFQALKEARQAALSRDYSEAFTEKTASGAGRYRVTWMDKDGAYEERLFVSDVAIHPGDGVLTVVSETVQLVLVIPLQRLVRLEYEPAA